MKNNSLIETDECEVITLENNLVIIDKRYEVLKICSLNNPSNCIEMGSWRIIDIAYHIDKTPVLGDESYLNYEFDSLNGNDEINYGEDWVTIMRDKNLILMSIDGLEKLAGYLHLKYEVK